MAAKGSILFFLDHCVPVSVGHILEKAGHSVVYLREWLPQDAKDQAVAKTAEMNGAVLVSLDADFRKIAPRIPKGHKARFKKLDHLRLECPEPKAASRVQGAMQFIEAEHEIAHSDASGGSRMIVSIGAGILRTHR
jgi:hypothetical protein